MKTLLIAINSRNLHTNLGVRYLYTSCIEKQLDVEIYEGNINIRTEELLSKIYRKEISIYCFSTYIWNITEILKLASSLKKLNPFALIIFGGPEASFRYQEFLASPSIDYVIRGDGELAFPELLSEIEENLEKNPIENSAEHSDKNLKADSIANLNQLVENKNIFHQVHADSIPFPYANLEMLPSKDQLLYYETSRGCPFACSYCLSSSMYSVTYRSLEKVFHELRFFIEQQVPLIKFVDRTWNSNRERAKEILLFILENPSKTKFHFEVAGDLFDGELLALMKKLPYDAIQLEIGVQSSNETALEAACRKTDLKKLKANVTEIISWGNIHVHLDLIAGLPYESFDSFGRSFDFVFSMKSQMLQLGFLKLLHGSALRLQWKKYGIVSNDFPPYEVLYTSHILYDEMLQLKLVEEILEQYYNSGRNRYLIDFLLEHFSYSPFTFFLNFSKYLEKEGFFNRKQGPKDSFQFLYQFIKSEELFRDQFLSIEKIVLELMKYDWIVSGVNSPPPEFLIFPENSFIKKYLLSYPNIPKECNWFLASKQTIDYLVENTKLLELYKNLISTLKKTDSLLFLFNSAKGKKIDVRLLNVMVFDTTLLLPFEQI